jgi:hypothetical protein
MLRYIHITIEYNTDDIYKAELLERIREAIQHSRSCIIESSKPTSSFSESRKEAPK